MMTSRFKRTAPVPTTRRPPTPHRRAAPGQLVLRSRPLVPDPPGRPSAPMWAGPPSRQNPRRRRLTCRTRAPLLWPLPPRSRPCPCWPGLRARTASATAWSRGQRSPVAPPPASEPLPPPLPRPPTPTLSLQPSSSSLASLTGERSHQGICGSRSNWLAANIRSGVCVAFSSWRPSLSWIRTTPEPGKGGGELFRTHGGSVQLLQLCLVSIDRRSLWR